MSLLWKTVSSTSKTRWLIPKLSSSPGLLCFSFQRYSGATFPGKRPSFQRASFCVPLISCVPASAVRVRDFLWCLHFLIYPDFLVCVGWLCCFRQIRSPIPTGIFCWQEALFTRSRLLENICVLPRQTGSSDKQLLLFVLFSFFSFSDIIILKVTISLEKVIIMLTWFFLFYVSFPGLIWRGALNTRDALVWRLED